MEIKAILAAALLVVLVSVHVSGQEPAAVISGQTITVNVLGLVNKPSRFTLPAGGTVLDALATAGGAAKEGNLNRVRLIHRTTEEKPDAVIISVQWILDGKGKDIALRDGDTLYVAGAAF